MNDIKFGDYVRQLRLAKIDEKTGRALSRSEMARRTGFTAQYAMDIENNRVIPSEDKIERIVEMLDGDERIAFKLADKVPLRLIEEIKKDFYRE